MASEGEIRTDEARKVIRFLLGQALPPLVRAWIAAEGYFIARKHHHDAGDTGADSNIDFELQDECEKAEEESRKLVPDDD